MIPSNDSLMDQRKVWDSIADKWAEYREEPIPVVQDFLKDKKGNVLDLGCGSGRNLRKIDGKIFGVDFSKKQVDNTIKKAKALNINFEGFVSDASKIPFKDNFFDGAICISTIHCIEGEDNRKKAVEELFRVLKPGAEAMISTWDKFREIKKGKKEEMVGFVVDDKSYKRYYYYFTQEEFIDLIKTCGFEILKVVADEYTGKNRTFRHNIEVYAKKP